MDMKALVEQAKQRQAANHANEKIEDYFGQELVVVGLHITKDVEIKSANLTIDKLTISTEDGHYIDGWTAAATEQGASLIEVLGEGPYTPPITMMIEAQETKRKTVYYPEVTGIWDPNGTYLLDQAAAQIDYDVELGKTPEETPMVDATHTQAE